MTLSQSTTSVIRFGGYRIMRRWSRRSPKFRTSTLPTVIIAPPARGARAELKETGFSFIGNEEYNFFQCVVFPDNQLRILPYNRVVKDLNGMSKDDFLSRVREN